MGDLEPTVLKLGGSVVTRKDEPETVDDETLAAVSETIATSLGRRPVDGAAGYPESEAADGNHGAEGPQDEPGGSGLVLVHGGGSFGHYHADHHGVSTTNGTNDATAIGDIHAAMTALNGAVVGRLRDAGVPVVPVRPFSAAARDEAGDLSYSAAPVHTMLAEDLVPVLHGDVVAHAGEGATICSGDELVVALARSLGAERVGVCSTVPGVLDETGAVVGRIDAFGDVSTFLGESEATDVTGGMAAKVRALLDLEAPASVFGVDDLGAFLDGENPGTTVDYEP